MKSIFHAADTRGHANHGWLDAYHSFSFANWQNRDRVHFGALRVLNDDKIAGGRGFGSHPHDNMEIVTIPLEGALEHKDSMGNQGRIQAGDVQAMSAGTGVFHSEFNGNAAEDCRLLQIWVFPNQKNVAPRYDQKTFLPEGRANQFQVLVGPDGSDGAMNIHQNAWFSLGQFDAGRAENYAVKWAGNGVYAFLISGAATIGGQKLNRRDAVGIWETVGFDIKMEENSELLLIDVPMEF